MSLEVGGHFAHIQGENIKVGFGLVGIQVTLLIQEDGPEEIEPPKGAFALLFFMSDQGPDPEALSLSSLSKGKDGPEKVIGVGLSLFDAGEKGPEHKVDFIPRKSVPEYSAQGEKTAVGFSVFGLAPEKGKEVHILLFPVILMKRLVRKIKRNETGLNAFRCLPIAPQRIEELQFFSLVFYIFPVGKEGPKGPLLFLRALDLRVKGTGGIQSADLFFWIGLDMKKRGDIFRGKILGKMGTTGS